MDGGKGPKELEDSGSNYVDPESSERKMHDWWSDTIRMMKFIAEVQIINNGFCKLMHTITREKGVDEKLIRLVNNSVQGTGGKVTQAHQEADQQVEPDKLWFFSDEKNFFQEDQLPEPLVACCLT